jgi:hypothetical protein
MGQTRGYVDVPLAKSEIEKAVATYQDEPLPPPEHPHAKVGRMVTDLLPTIGGIAGGVIGGIGGTVAGAGVGGVPGAIGGATLGGAAGEAGRQLVNRATGREAPGTPAEAATSIGLQGGLQGAAEAVGGAVTRGVASGARAVYRGYLKPPLAERMLPKAEQTVTTAMDEGLPVSEAGRDRGLEIIADLKGKVDQMVQATGRTIDLKAVANAIRGFARAKYYKPGTDLSDFNTALSVADKIDNHPSLGIPQGVSPTAVRVKLADANEIKRALDASIGDAQFGVTSGAKTATEKVARHEVNTAMRAQMPAMGPLNARESRLIDATKAIARAVEREANQNPLYGWKTLASAGLGVGASGSGEDPVTAAALAFGARYAMQPQVATRLAMTAQRAARQFGLTATQAVRLAAAAITTEGAPPQ